MSGRTDGDSISRAAAIRIVSGFCHPVNVAKELAKLPAVEPDILTCADCRYADGQIADGRYWCKYHEDYMRYCSDAERRQ